MEIKRCLNLLIVCVVLGQGIAVASEENEDASSALRLRQKRSSRDVIKTSPAPPPPSEIIGYLSKPERPGVEVGTYNPGRWEGRLPFGMVRIYHGPIELGLGIVVMDRFLVMKAHIFPAEVQAGEFHVRYQDETGQLVRRNIKKVLQHNLFKEYHERPWGPNDVGMAKTDFEMLKGPDVPALLRESRLFTLEQIGWIVLRSGPQETRAE